MSGVQLVFCSLSPYDEETLGCRCTTEQQNCYRFYQLLPKHVVVPGYNNHTRKTHMLSIWDGKVLLMDKTSVKQLEMLTKAFVNHFGFSSPEFVHQQYIRTQHTHLKGICTVFFLSECCYGLIVSVRVDSTQSICGQPLTVMLPDSLALIPS